MSDQIPAQKGEVSYFRKAFYLLSAAGLATTVTLLDAPASVQDTARPPLAAPQEPAPKDNASMPAPATPALQPPTVAAPKVTQTAPPPPAPPLPPPPLASPLQKADDKSWTIIIRPAYSFEDGEPVQVASPALPVPQAPALKSSGAPAPAVQSPASAAVSGNLPHPGVPPLYEGPVTAAFGTPYVMSYHQAYESIPFRRSEYEANPGYRHDAAMEIMFGMMRPTTIMKQNTPYFARYPDIFRYRYPVFPYPDLGMGATSRNYWNWNYGY